MINVAIKRSKEYSVIQQVHVSGHANYAEHPNDIVCAGVSAIVFGTLNAICELWGEGSTTVNVQENEVLIEAELDINVCNVLEVMYYQLKTLEENYNEYISIQEQEV